MMTTKSRIAILLLPLILAGCPSKPKSDAAAANWAGRMQGLASEVRELIPFIFSRKAYSDPANAPQIKAGLKKMAAQAHKITPDAGQTHFGPDPMVAFTLTEMQGDLVRAGEAFVLGQTEYSRTVAKSVTNHCFRCHSVTKTTGAAAWDLSSFSTVELTGLEKVDLLLASRRDEEATKYLESLLADAKFVQTYPFDFEIALRKYLALVLRVEKNPSRALKELDQVLAIKAVPFYINEQAQAWRRSLKEWVRQSNARADLIGQAKKFISRATQIQQFARDHAGDIEYLRATAALHEYLAKKPKTKAGLAEAYWLLGESYEVLDELGDWNLHELYFESCIKAFPHSDLAKKCFGRLEASIYFGFSGSSGVHIPEGDRQKLGQLKEMTL
jgi:hypothetical protein